MCRDPRPGHTTPREPRPTPERPLDTTPSDHSQPNGGWLRDVIPPHADGAGLIFGGPAAAWLRQKGGYALRGFRYADYRRYWFMLLADTFGIWMRSTAAMWLVYDLSHQDARMLGWFVGAATFTSMLLLPLAGAAADRFNRRVVAGCVLTGQGLLSALVAFLVYRHMLQAWHLVAFGAMVGVLNAFRQPANQSILVNVVKPKDLPNAVALNHVQTNLTRISAPVLAGLLIVYAGPCWPFVVQVGTVVVSLTLLTRIRYSGKAPRPNLQVLEALGNGARFLRRRSDLITIVGLVLVSAALGQISITMLPALAKKAFDGGVMAFATLNSFFAFGALLGAVTLATHRGRPLSPWRVYVPLAGWGCLQTALGSTASFAVALALIACVGACFTASRAMLFAGIHATTPDHMRGRIASFFTLSVMAGAGTGGWLAGQLAQRIGIQTVYQIFGSVLLLLVPLVLLAARRFNVAEHWQACPNPVRQVP